MPFLDVFAYAPGPGSTRLILNEDQNPKLTVALPGIRFTMMMALRMFQRKRKIPCRILEGNDVVDCL